MVEKHDMAPVKVYQVCSEIASRVQELEYKDREAAVHASGSHARWTCVRCSWPQSRAVYEFSQLQKHFEER